MHNPKLLNEKRQKVNDNKVKKSSNIILFINKLFKAMHWNQKEIKSGVKSLIQNILEKTT